MAQEFEKRGPEEKHAYGAASVTMALKQADFPCSRQELIDQYGDKQIYWTKNNPMKLRDILEQLPQEEFRQMPDVVEAIGKMNKAARGAGTRQ